MGRSTSSSLKSSSSLWLCRKQSRIRKSYSTAVPGVRRVVIRKKVRKRAKMQPKREESMTASMDEHENAASERVTSNRPSKERSRSRTVSRSASYLQPMGTLPVETQEFRRLRTQRLNELESMSPAEMYYNSLQESAQFIVSVHLAIQAAANAIDARRNVEKLTLRQHMYAPLGVHANSLLDSEQRRALEAETHVQIPLVRWSDIPMEQCSPWRVPHFLEPQDYLDQ